MPEKNQPTLREILGDAMEARGLNIERLAQMTDVPERYLIAIRDNDTKRLPAAPYIRGYLMKIGLTLGISGQELWDSYRNQNPVKKSGLEDRLPANRFAVKPKSRKWLVFAAIIFISIIYLLWRGGDFWGAPRIEITNPIVNNFVTKDSRIRLRGDISPVDKLMINGEEVIADKNGHFEKDFSLEPGLNTVQFVVKRFLGRETAVVRQIIYQP